MSPKYANLGIGPQEFFGGNQTAWSKPVYKYVDFEHAEAFARGSVKIGTLWEYASKTGRREDSGEASTFRCITDMVPEDDPIYEFLRFSGINIPAGIKISGLKSGTQINYRSDDFYCCCFSSRRYNQERKSKYPQALFEIRDLNKWARTVRGLFGELGPYTCKAVTYKSREWIAQETSFESRFRKPTSHDWENEVRVIWESGGGNPLPRIAPSESNEILASLLNRIF